MRCSDRVGSARVHDEFGQLKSVVVCLGVNVPAPDDYDGRHPEFSKYVNEPWDPALLVDQQLAFFELLKRYDVELIELTPTTGLPWQMYTRDTGFVVGSTLVYCADRGLPDRAGEIDVLLATLDASMFDKVLAITEGTVEGGDVIVAPDELLVGVSSRTNRAAVDELAQGVDRPVRPLQLGDTVMHLDTRLTLLPNDVALLHPPSFTSTDLAYLASRYDCIEVTEQECASLGTNVFVIGPSTVVVHDGHDRIAEQIGQRSIAVELVPYSEPIALSGSFRCSTMPIRRE